MPIHRNRSASGAGQCQSRNVGAPQKGGRMGPVGFSDGFVIVMRRVRLAPTHSGRPLQSEPLCDGQSPALIVLASFQSNIQQNSVHLGFTKTSLYRTFPNPTTTLVLVLRDSM